MNLEPALSSLESIPRHLEAPPDGNESTLVLGPFRRAYEVSEQEDVIFLERPAKMVRGVDVRRIVRHYFPAIRTETITPFAICHKYMTPATKSADIARRRVPFSISLSVELKDWVDAARGPACRSRFIELMVKTYRALVEPYASGPAGPLPGGGSKAPAGDDS